MTESYEAIKQFVKSVSLPSIRPGQQVLSPELAPGRKSSIQPTDITKPEQRGDIVNKHSLKQQGHRWNTWG